jgi:hypothetical protein
MTDHRKKKILTILKQCLEKSLSKIQSLHFTKGFQELDRAVRITKILSKIEAKYPSKQSGELHNLSEECLVIHKNIDIILQTIQKEVNFELNSLEIQRKLQRYKLDGTIL